LISRAAKLMKLKGFPQARKHPFPEVTARKYP
jgi:hypothetical protein